MKIIQVCKGRHNHFLRIYIGNERYGTICFTTAEEFSKHEADYRAVVLSTDYGFDCDELPTHPAIEEYPPHNQSLESDQQGRAALVK